MKPRKCPTCNKDFVPKRYKNQIYCSNECYRKRGSQKNTEPKLNYLEKKYKTSVKNNATALHNGFPDFLVDNNEELKFVEVKGEYDIIRKSQVKVMDMLVKYGLKCYIAYEGETLIKWQDIKPHLNSSSSTTMRSVINKVDNR